ncbi:hypothetical protein QUB80_17225 [Chlorogloeopsis sp. ULAP01]|uniref:hypothetical protein n=1 Tax=Chlorogloeopsis sp. ULAP01 TaxID=3056483 RepID=UPI0025AA6439|nr:hypothetical protein [Chlorogloeopsis sp. ULAP01]MDM9382446.1 hypothetical protein [Chlorogloeopsis sp. ULAP01]
MVTQISVNNLVDDLAITDLTEEEAKIIIGGQDISLSPSFTVQPPNSSTQIPWQSLNPLVTQGLLSIANSFIP